jgi:hypothetical protein
MGRSPSSLTNSSLGLRPAYRNTFTGVQILDQAVLDAIRWAASPPDSRCVSNSPPSSVALYGYLVHGYWSDIGTLTRRCLGNQYGRCGVEHRFGCEPTTRCDGWRWLQRSWRPAEVVDPSVAGRPDNEMQVGVGIGPG